MIEYLEMGGYAAYVWSAFGIAAALMVGLFVQSRHAARQREVELAEIRMRVRPRPSRQPAPLRPRRDTESTAPEPGPVTVRSGGDGG